MTIIIISIITYQTRERLNDYEVNESNPVSLRTLISDLGIVEDIVISREMWPHTSSKYFYALAIPAPYRRL